MSKLNDLIAEIKEAAGKAEERPWLSVECGKDYKKIQAPAGYAVAINLIPSDADFIVLSANNIEKLALATELLWNHLNDEGYWGDPCHQECICETRKVKSKVEKILGNNG